VAWLEAALPDLLAAEGAAVLDGPDLLHADVRSDNLCFQGSRAILVDWNWACRGNGRFDIAAWLPSLYAEGGPAPETILPDEPELAALLSGFWAAQAGLPPPPDASGVREVQLLQLRTALPWAARALSLPPISPAG
jgi:Ser/Thr protein kinase RdoA (MazF antagonist)